MVADLAYGIGANGKLKVADPFLVSRALGEGQRAVDGASTLAQEVGAGTVVSGFVGHDRHHRFTLTIHVQQLGEVPGGAAAAWKRDWRDIAFTDEETPALVLHRMLPEILEALPLAAAVSLPKAGVAAGKASSQIKVTPRALVADEDKSIPGAVGLGVLAALSPEFSALTRERLFERAYLAALYANDAGPLNPFLGAYALMQLTRRPAALGLLAQQSTPPAIALRALLNGNLAAAQSATGQLTDSVEKLLLQLALRDLEGAYGRKLTTQPAETAQMFSTSRAAWQPYVDLRAGDLPLDSCRSAGHQDVAG